MQTADEMSDILLEALFLAEEVLSGPPGLSSRLLAERLVALDALLSNGRPLPHAWAHEGRR